MTIETKENANGKIYAYYIDGVKVRKNEIDGIINSRRDEIITVDYYTGKNFEILTHYGRGLKIVLTGCANTIMTRPAANELGYNVIRNFSGLYYGFCIVEKKSAEVDAEEYAITPAAMEIAIEAETKAANEEKIAAMQKEVADYIAKIDEQEKQDKVAAFERELIEKGIIKGTAKVANVTNETDGTEDDSEEELPDVMPADDDDTDDELIDEPVVDDGNFTFYDAQIHSYDDDFVSEQFDNPIDAYKWLEMKIKQSYALERGTRQIEFYGKDSYKVIYRYIPDCRELFIDDTLLENFIANKTPKFTYKTKRGKIRTLKIGETNFGTEDNTILNQPKMPPVALKSHANSHDNTNTIDREKTSQIGIEAKIAQLNKNAPDNLQISFDKDKNNFPVKFKGKTITTLDTLALKNFLTPEQFFQQFRPLFDKDYSPKEQFIDDRKKELANLQEMRKSIKDTERLKTIDALIDITKRDLLEVSLE